MSDYTLAEKFFIVTTFYGNSDSHSVTIKKYVERFGPSKKPTADIINAIVEEFEMNGSFSGDIEAPERLAGKARSIDIINKVADLLEKQPKMRQIDIAERVGVSRSLVGNIMRRELGIRKRFLRYIKRKPVRPESTIKAVAEMLKIEPKMSKAEIVRKLGITKHLLTKIIEEDIPKLQDGSTIQSEIVDTSNKANPMANIKESEQDDRAEEVSASTSSGFNLANEHPLDLSKKPKKPEPKTACDLRKLVAKLIESNDPQIQNEIAKKLNIPQEYIPIIRRNSSL